MDVMTPEEKWTDQSLDDLDKKVEDGFARSDKSLCEFRGEVNAQFEKADSRFEKVEGKIEGGIKELRGEMNAQFDKIDERFERLDRTLLGAAVAVIITLIGCCATLVGVAVL
jgi:tetrahydromethanopterin S-methyltransferase subunit G